MFAFPWLQAEQGTHNSAIRASLAERSRREYSTHRPVLLIAAWGAYFFGG